MIKNIIYVEDGSVDVDELEESLGEDTKVIVYRHGATRPEIEHLEEPLATKDDVIKNDICKRIESTGFMFSELNRMNMSKQVRSLVKKIHNTLFGTDEANV